MEFVSNRVQNNDDVDQDDVKDGMKPKATGMNEEDEDNDIGRTGERYRTNRRANHKQIINTKSYRTVKMMICEENNKEDVELNKETFNQYDAQLFLLNFNLRIALIKKKKQTENSNTYTIRKKITIK
eukprot:813234_1